MTEHSRHAEAHINSIVKQEEEALRTQVRLGASRRHSRSLCREPYLCCASPCTRGCVGRDNTGRIPGVKPFDPWPFSLLGVMVAVEAVVLSSFIIMRQNRMMRRGEQRDHLNLQIDLLAEKEITALLQMVRALCAHMGLQSIAADKDFASSVKILPSSR